MHVHTHMYTHTCTHTCGWIVIHDHVLDDHVTVQLVWVVVFIAATAMLVSPLNCEIGTLPFSFSALPEFLGEMERCLFGRCNVSFSNTTQLNKHANDVPYNVKSL